MINTFLISPMPDQSQIVTALTLQHLGFLNNSYPQTIVTLHNKYNIQQAKNHT